MDLCKSKQLFLSRIERSSAVPPPPSSSPSKSPNQSRRRQKATSESVAHDLLIQRTALAVPGYAADNSKRYRGAHRAEGEESTEEEEEEDYDSFQLIGYPELASKDRFKSASLEWTTGPNGVVTPRASHYNTHPPLDFKSLKEKLKILIGSPHETNRKPFAAFSSSSSASGHDERKTGLSGLQSVPYVTSPSADMMCSEMLPDGNRPTSTELLRNISNKKEERLKNASKESHFLERSNRVLWKDLAHHVAESDKTLQMILNRHHKELEDLKKKHEKQWIQLKSQISKSKDVQNLGRELMLNSEVRCSQTLTRSKSDIQLTAYEAATKLPNRYRPTSKSELSETGRRDGMMSKHRNEYAVCPAAANFTDSYRDIIIHARPGGSAPPKENCPHAQRDANYPLPLINSHLMGSFYPTVSGVTQLTRSVDARCVSPISQRQSELEMAKQLENQMHALISLRLMHHQQQLTNLDLAAAAAKAQRPLVGTGFYALPNGCFQYFCMPMLQQLQSPTVFAAAAPPTPIYQETVCPPPPPPPPTNTFPGAGTSFPWNRTEFPQRMGSRTPCREFVQHHAPGNVLPDPSRQFLYNSLEQLALPSEIARINSSSFAPSPIVVKAQPPAPPIAPCFDNNNYLNSGYSFPCFVNPFQSVPMSFLHPSMMQYPAPDFKDLHQPFIPQPTDHQPYLTWS